MLKNILVLATGLAISSVAFAATKEIRETYPIDPDGTISVDNINGDIEISGWDRDEVELHAIVKARKEEHLDRIEIDISATSSRFSVETDYEKQSGWWGNNSNNSGEGTYILQVPRNAQLRSVESVNGAIEVIGVAGSMNLSTVNGDIEASGLTGDAEIDTVNGSIEVQFDKMNDRQDVVLDSVNGSIRVDLPENASARLDASTVHGRISSNLDLEVEKGRFVGSDLRDVVGGGDATISMENVNGSIRIEGRAR